MREKDAVRLYAIPKEELVDFRGTLTEGVDWERLPQGVRPLRMCPIAFTDTGWAKVVEKFGLTLAEAPKEVPPEPVAEDKMQEATVLRCDYPNVRIMLVRLFDGKAVICRVFDSRRFKPRMPVAVTFRGGKYYCEHRPSSLLRINTLIKRHNDEPPKV